MVTIQTNVDEFNRTLAQYAAASRRDFNESVVRQGVKLTYQLRKEFATMKPGKGAIRQERLAALAAGDGIKVRESAFKSVERQFEKRAGAHRMLSDKKLRWGKSATAVDSKGRNLWALAVAKELNLRERGRGFVAFGAWLGGLKKIGSLVKNQAMAWGLTAEEFSKGRYGQELARAGLRIAGSESGLELAYGGNKSLLGEAMSKPKLRPTIGKALRAVTEDMRVYIRRKAAENARRILGTP